ncbi:hypothetical protein EN788_36050 [Mesorhizobium sp. M2D.F.Ca.ET.145.01.1.1]|nr:hypothetical protein EN788_36050 [Mesorhizobium sp. M2D.F.Ca.ET.145.01.1.1]
MRDIPFRAAPRPGSIEHGSLDHGSASTTAAPRPRQRLAAGKPEHMAQCYQAARQPARAAMEGIPRAA